MVPKNVVKRNVLDRKMDNTYRQPSLESKVPIIAGKMANEEIHFIVN